MSSLSGNKGLCGVSPLPACPLFWDHGSLSTGGKIAIGIACSVFFCVLLLVIYIFCIRRGNDDYDFGLPQDLMCKFDLKGIRPSTVFWLHMLHLLVDIVMCCLFHLLYSLIQMLLTLGFLCVTLHKTRNYFPLD